MRWPRLQQGLRLVWSRLRQQNPLLLCGVILFALAGLISLDQSLRAKATALESARGAYLEALTATKTQLAGLLAAVAKDGTIGKAADWKLTHSTKQTLRGFLQRGALDEVGLFGPGCKTIASVGLESATQVACPEGASSPGITWRHQDDLITLSMHHPLSAGRTIVGQVVLGSDWQHLHPDLDQWLRQLGLTIGTETASEAHPLIKEGQEQNGNHAAVLYAHHWHDRYADAWGAENDQVLPLMQNLIILCIALIGWVAYRNREGQLRRRRELTKFVDWCRSLSPLASHTAAEKDYSSIPQAQKFVSLALQTKLDTIRQLTGRRDQLESTLRSREKDIQHLQRRLADLAELDSLAGQLQESIASFLMKLHQLHGRTRDLEHLLQTSVGDRTQTLYTIFEQWQVGIQEKGARKFLRSMSETASTDGTTSLLEEQLAALQAMISELHDESISGTMITHDIVETASLASQIANHWHSLSSTEEEHCEGASLEDATEQAADLVRLTRPFDLSTHIGDVPLPPIPEKIWVAAIHHLILALSELWDDKQEEKLLSLVARTRQHKLHGWYILAIDGAPTAVRPAADMDHHLDVARAILGPFDVEITLLPTTGGVPPVALRWDADPKALPRAEHLQLTSNPEVESEL